MRPKKFVKKVLNGKSFYSTAQQIFKQKSHINIATLGDQGCGKTTLTQAILKTLNNNESLHDTNLDFFQLNESKLKNASSCLTSNIEFETNYRHYLLADNPGNSDYITNFIVGTSQCEAGILVVDGINGTNNITKEHIIIANHMGIKQLIVYITKLDHESFDPELMSLIEMEVKELLESYNYDGRVCIYI